MSPLPETNKYLYSGQGKPETQKTHFFQAQIQPETVLSFPNPKDLMDPAYLEDLGVYLVTPNNAVPGKGSVIEIEEVVRGIVTNSIVIHKTKLPGIYVRIGYYPIDYKDKQPVFASNPYKFNQGSLIRLGDQANQQYLSSLK